MNYGVKTWGRAVHILKGQPNIPLSEFADLFDLHLTGARDLIRDVVEIHKIEREGDRPRTYKKDYSRNRKIPNRPLDETYKSRPVAGQNTKFVNPNHS